jgi:hypothetical protein
MSTDKEIIKQIEVIEGLLSDLKLDLEGRSKQGKLQVGDKVRIVNPKEGQESEGTVSKISPFRVTIITPKGISILRAPKNLQRR